MSRDYMLSDWYWFLDGDTTKVFSSKIGDFVTLTDPVYLSFKADGGQTYSTTTAGLAASLSAASLRPVNASMLDSYQGMQAGSIVTQSIFKILFNHENRLRAIERALSLNGSPPNLTPAQALAAVKALM